ncbi:MAG: patatin-like phospholipase family protein [Acidobacteriia bacterium]|nr:patatin-like phospholipase family protein [Terriglobia bacterium]
MTSVAFVYLRRIPVLIGALLILAPVLALLPSSPVTSLLQNLFLLSLWGTFWTTVTVLMVAWSLVLTGRLVLGNGDRFSLPKETWALSLSGRSVIWLLVLSLPTIIGPFTQSRDFHYSSSDLWERAGVTVLGFVFAYLLAFAALFFAVLFAPKDSQESAFTFPAFEFMRAWLRWASSHETAPIWVLRIGQWVRDHLPRGLWIGYLEPDGFLRGSQWLALMFSLATLCVYFVIDFYAGARVDESPNVPALAMILILLLNANWVLAALTFFLDRYRIPVLVPMVLLVALNGNLPSTDHFYITSTPAPLTLVRAADVLAERARQHKPIVVVATAGGGIQAAAWTVQVMKGLQQESRSWHNFLFSDSVAMISSVSGGATGSMFYLNLYHPGEPVGFDEKGLEGLVGVTSQSSLDQVAWALVYHDIPRVFLPFWDSRSKESIFDRGYILERTWRNRGNIQANLADWRRGVREGQRPASIFNSTIDETGQPLAMPTTDMSSSGDPKRESFYGLYPNYDLPVVTSVRLAATFPYVTPAARRVSNNPEYHMIDGGYYDNYGVSSLLAWLDEGLRTLQAEQKPLPDILVIQVRSFPDDAVAAPTARGWFFQTYAPVLGLLNVRTTAQLIRDRDALQMFQQRWARTAGESNLSRIQTATFEFQGHNAPLSWAMNPRQIDEIGEHWKDYQKPDQKDTLAVHCFFEAGFPGCPVKNGN